MLQNSNYHPNSFSKPSFSHLHPRVVDCPNFSFEFSPISQTVPTQLRAPHSPYDLRPPPPIDYHNS